MRAWRGPHKVVQVFQDGRVYLLDTGQKVHFERLKPHNSGPLELAAAHADSGEVVVLMDPEPERSVDVVDDDKSLPSYKTEQLLSEASDVSLPSRRRHWMDTRLRTKLRAGGSRMHYQQFDCSTSGTDDELSDVMLPVPPDPLMLIKWSLRLPCLLQINRYHPLNIYLNYSNYSLTMSVRALRHNKYLLLGNSRRCRERRHPR